MARPSIREEPGDGTNRSSQCSAANLETIQCQYVCEACPNQPCEGLHQTALEAWPPHVVGSVEHQQPIGRIEFRLHVGPQIGSARPGLARLADCVLVRSPSMC